jgi:hypothetical protein
MSHSEQKFEADDNLADHLSHLANQMDLVATIIQERREETPMLSIAALLMLMGKDLRAVADRMRSEYGPRKRSAE